MPAHLLTRLDTMALNCSPWEQAVGRGLSGLGHRFVSAAAATHLEHSCWQKLCREDAAMTLLGLWLPCKINNGSRTATFRHDAAWRVYGVEYAASGGYWSSTYQPLATSGSSKAQPTDSSGCCLTLLHTESATDLATTSSIYLSFR